LNWIHVLREEGHELFQLHDSSARDEIIPHLDLYLNVPWWSEMSCWIGSIKYARHAHLHYGTTCADGAPFVGEEKNCPSITCTKDGSCSIIAGYKVDYTTSLRQWGRSERKYDIGLMPIPFSDSMLSTDVMTRPFERRGIAWMAKDIFIARNEENEPWIPQVGLSYLRALVRLSKKTDFTLYFLRYGDRPVTDEVSALLSQLRVEYLPPLAFRDVLRLMPSIKLNLCVAGKASCTLDSLFCRAVPLGHSDGFLMHTARREFPAALLPPTRLTTEDDIYALLEQMWFDYPFFRNVEDCYQEEFVPHYKPNALTHFERFVQNDSTR